MSRKKICDFSCTYLKYSEFICICIWFFKHFYMSTGDGKMSLHVVHISSILGKLSELKDGCNFPLHIFYSSPFPSISLPLICTFIFISAFSWYHLNWNLLLSLNHYLILDEKKCKPLPSNMIMNFTYYYLQFIYIYVYIAGILPIPRTRTRKHCTKVILCDLSYKLICWYFIFFFQN